MFKTDVESSEPVQHQLTRLIRARILNGQLPVGQKLPSALEWARQLGTNYFTLHSALIPLVEEGLIERRQRLGSFVRSNRPVVSKTIGVYGAPSSLNATHLGFFWAVHESLRHRLGKGGHRIRLWMDGRRPEEQAEPLPELLQSAEEGDIQGLAVLQANKRNLPWLQKLPVPASFLSSGNVSNKVSFDHRQFLDLGLDRLKERGCRSVGCILNICPADSEPGFTHPSLRFYENFVALCREKGLEFHNEWIRGPRRMEEVESAPELFGYIQTLRLMSQARRPEGVIVYPDVVALGVARAFAEDPTLARPRLVFHRNNRSRLDFPPLPVSWIGSDEETVVDGLLSLLDRQAAGEKVTPVTVSYEISATEEMPFPENHP